MPIDPVLAFYLAPLVAIWTYYAVSRKRDERRARAQHDEAVKSGLDQPASLHPVIDPAKCIGCKACVNACPEGEILGLIGNKARLLEPANCIGHGACKAACPAGAITLVFGTETRGVDLPVVSPNFETNVPGLFIAGELGGMGLIRNAVEQGRQAIEEIARRRRASSQGVLDVLIVGAGPAGLSASLGALERGLRFVTIEQDSLGGTIAHYPRGKVVMTAPVKLPMIGAMSFREVSKEALMTFWSDVIAETGLAVQFQERVEAIQATAGGFVVRTTRTTYATCSVLLAIGRRGTPRRLGVPGEEQPKVVYRMVDPEQFRGQHVLVVGGGDSALEAAASVADEPGTQVTLSYRSAAFARAKTKNRDRVEAARTSGRLRVVLSSEVVSIEPDRVVLKSDDQTFELQNDAVIVCAGGILPTDFLKSCGIEIETKYGTA
ncbi:MAG: NAD(P)-binding domain-containing protein [Hyphomicrobium sp.]|nr:NAD(P)-binding domain-containing protein [Hyphomicrobium sp.]